MRTIPQTTSKTTKYINLEENEPNEKEQTKEDPIENTPTEIEPTEDTPTEIEPIEDDSIESPGNSPKRSPRSSTHLTAHLWKAQYIVQELTLHNRKYMTA